MWLVPDRWERMRLLLHDFGDYAFSRQLATWLANHGYEVLHVRAGDLGGPNSRSLAAGPADRPFGLTHVDLPLGRPFNRYRLLARIRDELTYSAQLADVVGDWRPDLVLSTNAPPLVQHRLRRACARSAACFVNWVQDIFGLAGSVMPGRWSPLLRLGLLSLLRRIEFASISRADAVVLIAPDFQDRLHAAGVRLDRVLIQENWAPIDPVNAPMRRNSWSSDQGLDDTLVLMLAGTLGLKHNPGLILALARHMESSPDTRLVVVSEGPGRGYLEANQKREQLDNLLLLDYQPAATVPAMLASADIGIVILNRGAASASVPSKLYAYAAAGRPVLAAVPSDNLAHRLIRRHGLGLVVEPEDEAGFLAAADHLLANPALRATCAASARAFAEEHCNIDRIGLRFDQLFKGLRRR